MGILTGILKSKLLTLSGNVWLEWKVPTVTNASALIKVLKVFDIVHLGVPQDPAELEAVAAGGLLRDLRQEVPLRPAGVNLEINLFLPH